MERDRHRETYDLAMEAGAAEYQDVLEALEAAGLPAQFTQTGGMNAALEVQLETGARLLITDEADALSWSRRSQLGWGVGLYPGDDADGPDRFESSPETEVDVLLELVHAVLTSPTGS